MPQCERCQVVQASVEMRRLPRGYEHGYSWQRWVCKDKTACKARAEDRKETKS